MEKMIDFERVKELRKQRSWSQEELASISGLSHRTVQRIESNGACSIESQKALASAFDMPANTLNIDTVNVAVKKAAQKGRRLGMLGAGVGCLSAYAGITYSVINGYMSVGDAGIYYGSVAALCGICCAGVGVISQKINI